ncbi:MAG: PH domain-containing protein [Lachnospiraceae bacterium]|nr:PH domain-containing protein [Lachnospiraceae bacterium]
MWRARKRIWCGLPWTFTVYSFDDERFFVESGVLNKKEDEVRLYRIKDLTVTRSFIQRIFGMGTIHVDSADKTLKCFDIVNIKNVKEVKEELSKKVEAERDRKRVGMREYVNDEDDHEDIM